MTCRDEAEQTDWLVDRVLDHREQGAQLRQQAVLFRAQHHSMALEMELSRRHIPYRKYGGLRFVEMAHIKDLMSFLRLAENPRDAMAALRVLGLVPGIGPKTASTLQARLAEGGGDFEVWVGASVPEPASGVWPDLVSLMRALAGTHGDVPAQVHAVLTVYAPLLERRYDNASARLADIEQIEALAGRTPDRATLLAELAIDPPSWTSDLAGPPVLDEDWLVLSTMHSAKGLEFDVVYVIHAADGNIPSDMATGSPEEIEEERRLFYVACTRARHHLYVSHPLRYYKAGSRTHRRPRVCAAHPLHLRGGRPALPDARRCAGDLGLTGRATPARHVRTYPRRRPKAVVTGVPRAAATCCPPSLRSSSSLLDAQGHSG